MQRFFSNISIRNKSRFYTFRNLDSLFIATISGVIGQGPIGYFSDVYDRRKVIVITTLAGSILAFMSILSSNDPLQNTYYMNEFQIEKLYFFYLLVLTHLYACHYF